MQASKIKIGSHYAVMYDDQLRSLQVHRVITTRTGSHPSDFEHTVFGRIDGVKGELKYSPDGVKGPYEEYQQLVAEKAAAEAQRKAEAAAKDKTSKALVTLLYKLTGQTKTDGRYGNMFDNRYSGGVEITAEGARLLLALLSDRPALKVVS